MDSAETNRIQIRRVFRFGYDPGHSFGNFKRQWGNYEYESPFGFLLPRVRIQVGPNQGFVLDYHRRLIEDYGLLPGEELPGEGGRERDIMGYHPTGRLPM